MFEQPRLFLAYKIISVRKTFQRMLILLNRDEALWERTANMRSSRYIINVSFISVACVTDLESLCLIVAVTLHKRRKTDVH